MTPPKAAEGAVFASSGLLGFLSNVPTGLISLAVGLVGVALARWVFVNREARNRVKPQTWRETLPLTLVAMLIAGVIIHDRNLGLSAAAFAGLGVGWAAVLLLDVLGERVIAIVRAAMGSGPVAPMPPQADISGHGGKIIPREADIPADMAEQLDKLK